MWILAICLSLPSASALPASRVLLTTSFKAVGVTDVILSGGATFAAAPNPAIRSGSPKQHSLVQFVTELSPGATVKELAFAYQYSRGYSGATCSNFTVRVAGSPVYASPHLSDYPYSKSHPNYSLPIAVKKTGLSIQVPSKGVSRLELAFDNNDCNVQILTPLVINVSCADGPCARLPLLPQFFDSNMVLQRDTPANVYGSSGVPGETVTVTLVQHGKFSDQHASTIVPANGSWIVSLPPQKASEGWTVTVIAGSDQTKRTKVLKNVAFGDVYLCSGQSNMEVRVADAFNASSEIAASGSYPGIRMWTAANTIAESRQYDIPDLQNSTQVPAGEDIGPYAASSWATSAPAAFPKPNLQAFAKQDWFSAACYFFGRDVYVSQGGAVPIGLMASDWGGQPIEPFMSPDALSDKTCGGTRPAAAPADPPAPTHQNESLRSGNSVLWWGMTEPLVQMRMTGAVWYQGETNWGYAHQYSCSFPAMIHDWRSKFTNPDMMFLFVQLAPSTQLGNFVSLRNAQMAALKLPRVGYAVAVDIGDLESPMGSIHPRRKQEVGRRLSLEARRINYGETSLTSTGPVLRSVAKGSAPGTLVVSYAAGTAEGLHAAPTADCDKIGSKLCCGESPFQVKTANGTVRAKYTVQGATVLLTVDGVIDQPPSVTYAWEQWPQCSMYNGKGGCDDHTGVAGTPFCLKGGKACTV
jgi:sialate O-acetylesterase